MTAKYGSFFEILKVDPQDILEKNLKFHNGTVVTNESIEKYRKRNTKFSNTFNLNEFVI